MKSLSFMVNLNDGEGDIIEEGVYLCIDDTMVKVCDTVQEFQGIEEQIKTIAQEIEKYYAS